MAKFLNEEGLVLKSDKKGIYTLVIFTEKLGKIKAFYRKGKVPGILTPLNLLELQLVYRDDFEASNISYVYNIVQAMPKDVFFFIRRHSKKLAIAMMLLDFIEKGVSYGEPYPKLFKVLIKALKYIDRKDFSWGMLGLAVGLLLNLSLSHGFSLSDEALIRRLSSEEKELLVKLSSNPISALKSFAEQEPRLMVRFIGNLMSYLEEKLEVRFGSRGLLAELSKTL